MARKPRQARQPRATEESREVAVLPLPERLEPKKSARSLAIAVRGYFYALYNAAESGFQEMLRSTSNKDAPTGNRLFDRHVAVLKIKEAAKEAEDVVITASTKDGDIYHCVANLMRGHDLGLKVRRQQYRGLTQQAAE